MFYPKRIRRFVFGFVFLALSAVPAVAQADIPAVCLIGDHLGVPESDAQTAALLVCDELRKQGISVTDPVYEAPTSADAYRVVLRRLGEKIIVRLNHESPIGTIITERQLTLASIEEMIPAAPRLVDALVHDKPIDDTVDMETVTEQEARELRKISGESLWHVGVVGTFVPGTDIAAEPGFATGWSYETLGYAVGAEYWIGGISETENSNDFSFLVVSIGGRYFLNKANFSPYVGGGFSIVNATFKDESDSGLGAYGVVGIEALRLTKSRLNLELRVDRPFFSLPDQDLMPITLVVTFSRHYVPGRGGCLSGF